jgi:hypothetical protein
LKGTKRIIWKLMTKNYEVEVTLRPTVSRPVSLGVRRPSGTRDKFYFLLEIFFRQLRFYNFVAPSLTRGRVCDLLYNCFWALPEQSLLVRSPAELTAICILLSHLRLPQPKGPGPRIYIPHEQGGPVIPPGTGFPFCRILWLAGLLLKYSNPPPHGRGGGGGGNYEYGVVIFIGSIQLTLDVGLWRHLWISWRVMWIYGDTCEYPDAECGLMVTPVNMSMNIRVP